MPMTSSLGLQEALSKAEQFARERDYAGADPYDGLTSPVAGLVRGPLSRQLLLQSVKRSPIPLRKALAIRPIRMAKAVALFSDGYRLLGQEDYADRLADQLLATMGGGPWGYEFDVQTRWAYYKAGTPNVIATAFAVRALDRLDRLHEVNPAVLDWLYSLVDSRGYFHYTPASSALIHNGNLLAAEAVARLNGDEDIVSRALQVTLSQQKRDGSWTYGEDPKLAWIDNFHTVYVLESLRTLGSRGFEIGESLALGIDYWQNSLFTRDGMPLYFADCRQRNTTAFHPA